MKLEIFAVHDSAVNAFMQPFFASTKGAAIRSLGDAVNDPKHEFARHSGDYTLYSLGYFDDANGMFDCAPPLLVIACRELVTASLN